MSPTNVRVPGLAVLVLAALTTVAAAQSVTLTVTPNPATAGQQLRITFKNRTASTILLQNAAPWGVYDASNQMVFAPLPAPTTIRLTPGQSRGWNWDQRDMNFQQVTPGAFEVRLRYIVLPIYFVHEVKVPFRIDPSTMLLASGRAAPGTTVSFALRSPDFVMRSYRLAIALGKRPGIPVGAGRVLPLNPDPLFFASMTIGPPVFIDFAGQLDSTGRAAAQLRIPNLPQLRGMRFFAAFAVLHLAGPCGIGDVSPAVELNVP